MKKLPTSVVLLIGLWGSVLAAGSEAAVVVLANRSDAEVQFGIAQPQEKAREFKVAPGDLAAVPIRAGTEISYLSGSKRRQFRLDVNAAYYFADGPDGIHLEEIGFPGKPEDTPRTSSEPGTAAAEKLGACGTIRLQIYVDEEEPGVRRVWEQRLRGRIEAASAILEQHCRMKLEVVEAGEWESDNTITDLPHLLRDFERKVKARPGCLVIGFSSQRMPVEGRTLLGGIHLPLSTHIIVREWMPKSERERLEVLLHELGHYLGATHSPEANSVMRPNLGEDPGQLRRTRIGFDPVNTLVINLIAEGVRERGVKHLNQLSTPSRELLARIYAEVGRALPEDPCPPKYVRLLKQIGTTPLPAATDSTPLVESTRKVVAAVVEAAQRNERLPARAILGQTGPIRLRGDELSAYYFRAAAAAARGLPAEHAVGAYLLGLGVAVDDSDLLRTNIVTRALWTKVETETERQDRIKVLGQPTLQGRHDWIQHFVVSAALTAVTGARAAESAGILKELLDAQGSSGFSFADLAADLEGIAFASQVSASPNLLKGLANSFDLADYSFSHEGLPDSLSRDELAKQYGSLSDERFRKKVESIRARIRTLPAYRGNP